MNSEIILETFEKRLLMQRYAGNTIRSYKDYASIFLKHVSKYPSLEEIPLSDIEAFINEKVQNGKISVSYQKGLVGAIKKMYELILDLKSATIIQYTIKGLKSATIIQYTIKGRFMSR